MAISLFIHATAALEEKRNCSAFLVLKEVEITIRSV